LAVAGGTPVTGAAVPDPVPSSCTEDPPVDVFVVDGLPAALGDPVSAALGLVDR
jgi:hypothetical protein